MNVKGYNLTNLAKYSNAWLALEPESMKVVASGKEPGVVLKKAHKEGVEHPVLTRAPQNYGAYIL